LTFLRYGENDEVKSNYQGVLFKWGSLVGISPAQTSGSSDFSTSTPIYVYTPSGWKQTNLSTVSATGSSVAEEYGNFNRGTVTNIWERIPWYETGTGTSADNFFIKNSIEDNEKTNNVSSNTGDICRFLGTTNSAPTGYRLPTSDEFNYGNQGNYGINGGEDWGTDRGNDKWLKVGTSWSILNSAANSSGTLSTIPAGGKIFGITLPASGNRDYSDGKLSQVGLYGVYWSGSAHSSDIIFAYRLEFGSYFLYPGNSYYRYCGYTVRCVQD
jgi:uncharacterized protein (TIGR02145 family)